MLAVLYITVYNLTDYGHMLADRVRMDAYAYALKTAVSPDTVVLDIGTSIGIHALLACKFGARKVYAIEPDDTINLARELAELNGFTGHIEFIHDVSTNVTLPERADIIVSDLRGALPLFDQHIPSIIDARQRHLSPNGILIPQKDTLWVSVVEAGTIYETLLRPWDTPYGLKMDPAQQSALNQWQYDDTDLFQATNLLTEPTKWAVLNYNTINQSGVYCPKVEQAVICEGIAHGLLIWFDTKLTADIGFSCSPQAAKIPSVYGRGFFPLSKPVPLAIGNSIHLTIEAELTNKGYSWHWRTRIYGGNDKQLILADFDQASDLQ